MCFVVLSSVFAQKYVFCSDSIQPTRDVIYALAGDQDQVLAQNISSHIRAALYFNISTADIITDAEWLPGLSLRLSRDSFSDGGTPVNAGLSHAIYASSNNYMAREQMQMRFADFGPRPMWRPGT